VYTRCTACHTTHPVNASLLARAGGRFRCGKCQKIGNALDALYDEWPAAGERPPGPGEVPVLGLPLDLEQARKARQDGDEAGRSDDPEYAPDVIRSTTRRWLRPAWIGLAAVLIGVVAFEYAAFRGTPLTGSQALESTLTRLGLRAPPTEPPFRALDQIQLVSRELRSYPFEAGRLQLSATIVNRARRVQPYPDLEVVLLDAGGAEVGRTRFAPADYLAKNADGSKGMTPGAFLPLVLELADPGEQAVGFELNFR
jgi:predicted Zn finger-like uncharacterized protein